LSLCSFCSSRRCLQSAVWQGTDVRRGVVQVCCLPRGYTVNTNVVYIEIFLGAFRSRVFMALFLYNLYVCRLFH
jgi:hypothetical protein